MKTEVREAAAQAWNAALGGDWNTAITSLNAVANLAGAASSIVCAFADTVQAGMRRAGMTEVPDGVAWVGVDAPAPVVQYADEVSSSVAWAGRVLLARWRLDEDQWRALWAAIPEGHDSEYIGAALEACVHTFTAYGLDAAGGR